MELRGVVGVLDRPERSSLEVPPVFTPVRGAEGHQLPVTELTFDELVTGVSARIIEATPTDTSEATLAPESNVGAITQEKGHRTFRERLLGTRLGKMAVGGLTALGLAAGGVALEAAPAVADTTYQVQGTGSDGLWIHQSGQPGLHTQLLKVAPEGTSVNPQCYDVSDSVLGDPVWVRGVFQMPDGEQLQGEASDAYLSTQNWSSLSQYATQTGLQQCGTEQQPPAQSQQDPNLQPAANVPPFTTLDRQTAATWALDHAEETPPDAGSCTIFVSQALWAGGMPETDAWNNGINITKEGFRDGTDDAWAAHNLADYLQEQPYVTVEQLSMSGNNVPDARPGDIIAYAWHGGGFEAVTHLDIVTGHSSSNPDYPLVSGWSEDGSRALNYTQRGWTWSDVHNEWLQSEPGNQDMQAFLIHIRTEGDLNVQ